MEYGLKRNAEGYVDPTAYKAIVEADKPIAGDIFHEGDAEWLVLANNDGVLNVLKLLDESTANTVEVKSRAIKHTDPRYVQYRFYNPHTFELVKSIPQSDLDSILDAVRDVLGISCSETKFVSPPPVTIERVVEKTVDSEETKELRNECIALKHEKDVYMRLYQDMLERLIGR